MVRSIARRRSGECRRGPIRTVALLLLLALTGAGCARSAAPASTPIFQVNAQRFRFDGMPAHVGPGLFDVAFANREAFPFQHEMVVVSLQVGQGVASVIEDAKQKAAASEDDWLHWGEIPDVSTGAAKVGVFDLPTGTYALVCWRTGVPGGGEGEVHAARGMVFQFTVAST